MLKISETRAGKARASRNSCLGSFRYLNNSCILTTQFLIIICPSDGGDDAMIAIRKGGLDHG